MRSCRVPSVAAGDSGDRSQTEKDDPVKPVRYPSAGPIRTEPGTSTAGGIARPHSAAEVNQDRSVNGCEVGVGAILRGGGGAPAMSMGPSATRSHEHLSHLPHTPQHLLTGVPRPPVASPGSRASRDGTACSVSNRNSVCHCRSFVHVQCCDKAFTATAGHAEPHDSPLNVTKGVNTTSGPDHGAAGVADDASDAGAPAYRSLPAIAPPSLHRRSSSRKMPTEGLRVPGMGRHPTDILNESALARYTLNCSVNSITTLPPAASIHELRSHRSNGSRYLNNYRIIESLGRGACGKVDLAFDNAAQRLVAVKSVRRADQRKRLGGLSTAQQQFRAFLREINIMKGLRHRNIVSLYEVIDDPSADKLYLIMQYVEKGVIAKVRVRAGSDEVCVPVPAARLARYARELLAGLQYLHTHEVVHRDIKPDNILISGDDHAFLADFGVAETFDTAYRQRMETIMARSLRSDGSGPQVLGTKGTPLFIAPELWGGAESNGKPVDMWAMGVTLFTLLVGKLPFRSTDDITNREVTPTAPPEFGEEWATLIDGLLNRNPKERWVVEKARDFVKNVLVPIYNTKENSSTESVQPELLGETSSPPGGEQGAGRPAVCTAQGEGGQHHHHQLAGATTRPSLSIPTTPTVYAQVDSLEDGSHIKSRTLSMDFMSFSEVEGLESCSEHPASTTSEGNAAAALLHLNAALACTASSRSVAGDSEGNRCFPRYAHSADMSLQMPPLDGGGAPDESHRTEGGATSIVASQRSSGSHGSMSVVSGLPFSQLPPVIVVATGGEGSMMRGRRPCHLAGAPGGHSLRGRSRNAVALRAASSAAAAAASLSAHYRDLHRYPSEQQGPYSKTLAFLSSAGTSTLGSVGYTTPELGCIMAVHTDSGDSTNCRCKNRPNLSAGRREMSMTDHTVAACEGGGAGGASDASSSGSPPSPPVQAIQPTSNGNTSDRSINRINGP